MNDTERTLSDLAEVVAASALTERQRDRLYFEADNTRLAYENARAAFRADFEKNPVSALEWRSAGLARAQAVWDEFVGLFERLSPLAPEPLTVEIVRTHADHRIDMLTRTLLNPSSSQSTSPWANAIELERRVGESIALETWTRIAKTLEEN